MQAESDPAKANTHVAGTLVDRRSLRVRLLISNPDLLLKPEMLTSAALDLSDGGPAKVPAGAVFTEDGKSHVFAAINDQRFERRLIVAVPDAEGRLRVTSGLRVGERIATDGAIVPGRIPD